METWSWVELTKRAMCGTLFQNTTASAPKFLPFTVSTKGVLLTGTVAGSSVVSAGGLKLVPNRILGSRVPQPRGKTTARTNPRLRNARSSFPGRGRRVGQRNRLAERIRASWEIAVIVRRLERRVVRHLPGMPHGARSLGKNERRSRPLRTPETGRSPYPTTAKGGGEGRGIHDPLAKPRGEAHNSGHESEARLLGRVRDGSDRQRPGVGLAVLPAARAGGTGFVADFPFPDGAVVVPGIPRLLPLSARSDLGAGDWLAGVAHRGHGDLRLRCRAVVRQRAGGNGVAAGHPVARRVDFAAAGGGLLPALEKDAGEVAKGPSRAPADMPAAARTKQRRDDGGNARRNRAPVLELWHGRVFSGPVLTRLRAHFTNDKPWGTRCAKT